MKIKILSLAVLLFLHISIPAQVFEKIADETIGYVKASTFGKPDVAKKTNKIALSQVRVHYKIVTTRAAETRDNGAKVTVYLDGAMTNEDLQNLTNEFYTSLQRKLGALGIEFVDWDAITKTEYYNNREEATAEKNNINANGGNGQAWVSFTANQGPVFYRYELNKGFGELLAYGKMKKINKFTESLGADFASFDVVVESEYADESAALVIKENGKSAAKIELLKVKEGDALPAVSGVISQNNEKLMLKSTFNSSISFHISFWDLKKHIALGRFSLPPRDSAQEDQGYMIDATTISPDGKKAAMSFNGIWEDTESISMIAVYEIASKKSVLIKVKSETGLRFAESLAFSPDSKQIATLSTVLNPGSLIAKIQIWDAETGKLIREFQ